jgi:hypothetical protein
MADNTSMGASVLSRRLGDASVDAAALLAQPHKVTRRSKRP